MFAQKIKTLDELAAISRELKQQGKKIVQCHGVFDLMHPGHIKHFWAAKEKGDCLMVTITADQYVNKGPGRPVFNERLRAETIASLAPIDFVAISYHPHAVPTISAIQPNFYVKGNEYETSINDPERNMNSEAAIVMANGGQVIFTNEETFSSSELLNQFFEPYSKETQEFLREFKQNYTYGNILEFFEKIKNLKVLVVGEAIIDDYTYVQAMSKSPKEVIVATRYMNGELFAGGTLACANHLAGFCKQVDLVSILGQQDSHEEFIRTTLKNNINPTFFYQPNAPTIRKQRFINQPYLTKMFEVYHFNDGAIPPVLEHDLYIHLESIIANYDLVILIDYGHGFFTPKLKNLISEKARYLALNTQTNSANFGFNLVTGYSRADYVCIDHFEARLALGQQSIAPDQWEMAATNLAKKLQAKQVSITRGHEGCLTYGPDGTSHAPIFSGKVVDRVGAGDAFLSITAPLAAIGAPAPIIAFIGNVAGSIAVTIIGNKTHIEPKSMFRSVQFMLK